MPAMETPHTASSAVTTMGCVHDNTQTELRKGEKKWGCSLNRELMEGRAEHNVKEGREGPQACLGTGIPGTGNSQCQGPGALWRTGRAGVAGEQLGKVRAETSGEDGLDQGSGRPRQDLGPSLRGTGSPGGTLRRGGHAML